MTESEDHPCLRCGHKRSEHDWESMALQTEGAMPTHAPARCLHDNCDCQMYGQKGNN
jgi:hypothetical protein